MEDKVHVVNIQEEDEHGSVSYHPGHFKEEKEEEGARSWTMLICARSRMNRKRRWRSWKISRRRNE